MESVMLLHILIIIKHNSRLVLSMLLCSLWSCFVVAQQVQAEDFLQFEPSGNNQTLIALPEGSEPIVVIKAIADTQRVQLSAVIKIAAAVAVVWDTLVSCDKALQYVPDIRECEVLQTGIDQQGNAFDITRHRIKPYFFLPSVNSIFRANYQRPEHIEFYRQGGDLRFFRGQWQFIESDTDETLLYYQATVDLHKRLNQRSEMRILNRDVPRMLMDLRELAESILTE